MCGLLGFVCVLIGTSFSDEMKNEVLDELSRKDCKAIVLSLHFHMHDFTSVVRHRELSMVLHRNAVALIGDEMLSFRHKCEGFG